MITYFIIGIIVQLMIIVERDIRFPENWTSGDPRYWQFWASFIICFIFNVLTWPLSIACEIYAIIKGF